MIEEVVKHEMVTPREAATQIEAIKLLEIRETILTIVTIAI